MAVAFVPQRRIATVVRHTSQTSSILYRTAVPPVGPHCQRRLFGSGAFPDVNCSEEGERDTDKLRVFFTRDGKKISPWHDLPCSPARGLYTMVNEMPRGTDAKFEIAINEPYNPIKQDVKKGALRFIKYGPVLHNYGAIPQTWEDPSTRIAQVNGLPGDNDPVDVIDIGNKVLSRGEIALVKPLGVLGLIDDNECDWKIIAINIDDPRSADWNDIDDVERVQPGTVTEIRDWYRLYKTVDGKPENAYAFGGAVRGKAYAEGIISDCHHHWKRLRSGKSGTFGGAM